MGFKWVILCLCLDIIKATKVEMFSKWKPGVGWEIECSWVLLPNDALQSVTLFANNKEFMNYRPQNQGHHIHRSLQLTDDILVVDCAQTTGHGQEGRCILSLEVYRPPEEDFKYSCEVSGEAPQFRIDRKDLTILALVPPSDALIHAIPSTSTEQTPGRVTLNCTSSGLPPPTLEWTIGSQKPKHDFSGSDWNLTSKLWHVWSFLSYIPTSERLDVTCTPVISKNGQRIKGKPATYNRAHGFHGVVGSTIFFSLFLVLLK